MKKTMTKWVSLLMLVTVFVACSDNSAKKKAIGSWSNVTTEYGATIEQILTFKEDGTFTRALTSKMEDSRMGVTMVVDMNIETAGTWDMLQGDLMTVTFDKSKTKLLRLEVDFVNATEEQKAELENMKTAMEAGAVAGFNSEMPDGPQNYMNLIITEEELSYTALDGSETWTRVK